MLTAFRLLASCGAVSLPPGVKASAMGPKKEAKYALIILSISEQCELYSIEHAENIGSTMLKQLFIQEMTSPSRVSVAAAAQAMSSHVKLRQLGRGAGHRPFG